MIADVLGRVLHVPGMPPHTLAEGALAVYTFPNLVWAISVLCVVAVVLGRSPLSFVP